MIAPFVRYLSFSQLVQIFLALICRFGIIRLG